MRMREPAICLRTTDYSETSQVVHFLTRGAGVVRLLGKGTKRPKSKSGGALDLLCEGDLVCIASQGPTLGTLVEFTETVVHTGLRRDARRLNTALYMMELCASMLAEADPHPEVFDLLHSALARLGQADAPVPAVLAYFQWRLLRHVGLLGNLAACVSCGAKQIGTDPIFRLPRQSDAGLAPTVGNKPKIGSVPISSISSAPVYSGIYFSSSLGGLLCASCEMTATEKFALEPAALSALATLAAAEAGARAALPDAQAHAVNRMLAYHITQQLGRAPRMARHAIPRESPSPARPGGTP